jgi:DNA replication protein DnaC
MHVICGDRPAQAGKVPVKLHAQTFCQGTVIVDRADLLICDELGYLSFSRAGAELLFQVFADRYERRSLLITSNLAFGEWGQVFQGERMTAALLDRLTHRCHIFEMNGESYRFKESMKAKKDKDPKKSK